jgi:Domain of unknown function (DUF4388)
MAYLSGSLKAIPLPRLIELLAQKRASGWVYASQGPRIGQVYLEAGQVTLAVCGSQQGPDALESLVVGLPDGWFEFFGEAEDPPPEPNVRLAPEELRTLLDSSERLARLAEQGWIRWTPPAAVCPPLTPPPRPQPGARHSQVVSWALALLGFGLGGLATAAGLPELGVVLNVGLVLALVVYASFCPPQVGSLPLALASLPLVPIVGLTIPRFGLPPTAAYPLVSLPLVATALALARVVGVGFREQRARLAVGVLALLVAVATYAFDSPVDAGPAESAPGLIVLVLLGLLTARELAAVAGARLAPLTRNLSVATAPFLLLFALIAAERLLRLLPG